MKRRDLLALDNFRDALLGVCVVLLCIWAINAGSLAPGAAAPKVHGSYAVTFAGSAGGQGKATVTPKFVKIDGVIEDEQGNEIVFAAPKLDVDESTYRFKGSATLGGVSVAVAGRIDPDGTSLKSCRLVASYTAKDGAAGRIVGGKK